MPSVADQSGVSGSRAPSGTESSRGFAVLVLAERQGRLLRSLQRRSRTRAPSSCQLSFMLKANSASTPGISALARFTNPSWKMRLRVFHLHREVIPLHEVRGEVEPQAIVQPLRLQPDLVVLELVGRIVARQHRRRLQRVAAADAEPFRICRVHEAVFVEAVGHVQLDDRRRPRSSPGCRPAGKPVEPSGCSWMLRELAVVVEPACAGRDREVLRQVEADSSPNTATCSSSVS